MMSYFVEKIPQNTKKQYKCQEISFIRFYWNRRAATSWYILLSFVCEHSRLTCRFISIHERWNFDVFIFEPKQKSEESVEWNESIGHMA